ncbi:teichuronic acid biosynthesis protein TuaH [Peribacillus sp. SCS-37]|uniref:teichuronic acid biosynthesis protein TuaH n=1 Tax=Paraperibacillus esterisolvens TaxID=3115296 RepID=UPI003905BDFB
MEYVHVVVAAGTWEQDQLRYRRHRLAEFLLKKAGTKKVIWLCPGKQESVRELPGGLTEWVIPDLLPHRVFRFGRYVDRFYKTKLRRIREYLEQLPDHTICSLWYTFPGFPRLAEEIPWDQIVYDCSDLWSSSIDGSHSWLMEFRQKVISEAEGRIAGSADHIFCTSDFLAAHISASYDFKGEGIFTFENGVEYDLFAGETEKADIIRAGFDGPVLGFIGGIKPKLDFQLIKKAAQLKPDWLFLFVGPDGTKGDGAFTELQAEPNIIWTGSVKPDQVPRYMNAIDIGIMPYKESPYNRAVFPLKLFEFLAAGKPVVGVNLPSTEKYSREGIYSHLDYSDAEALIASCEKLAAISDKETEGKRKQLAKAFDWETVFERMAAIVLDEYPKPRAL